MTMESVITEQIKDNGERTARAPLTVATRKVPVIKAAQASIEKNSKGDKVTWLRLPQDIKDNGAYIVTSKNNCEYAARLEFAPTFVADSVEWLRQNQELDNVGEWLRGQFINVNRGIVGVAGAAGLEAELIGDIESLIAYETLQTARGRKAGKFDGEQWKAYSPILADCLKRFFEQKKIVNVAPLVNKYLHLIKGAIVNFSPIGDDAMVKAEEMIEYTFDWIVANKPEMETLGAFAITVMQSNREKYTMEEDDTGGY